MAGKKSDAGQYTKPELRDKIKNKVTAGSKGGRPGQWSARKAQLVAHEYEAEGGGYKHDRNEAQKSLTEWGEEHWTTQDGKEAVRGEQTARYLPEKAWDKLSPEEKKATEKPKRAASRKGQQYVANTAAANKARKGAEVHDSDPGHKAPPRKKSAAKKAPAKKAVAKKAAAPAKKSAAKKSAPKKAATPKKTVKKAPVKGRSPYA